MIDAEQLITLYTTTYDIIKRQTADMTQAESQLQFPFDGNCLNWTLGHITVARCNLLSMLDETDTVWDWAEAKRYIPGSAPITSSEDACPLDKILEALDRTQERLTEVLKNTSQEKLDSPFEDKTLGETLAFYNTHEAYHTGQIELCRRLAGKKEVIGF